MDLILLLPGFKYKSSLVKIILFCSRIKILVLETGNSIIKTGNGIIFTLSWLPIKNIPRAIQLVINSVIWSQQNN